MLILFPKKRFYLYSLRENYGIQHYGTCSYTLFACPLRGHMAQIGCPLCRRPFKICSQLLLNFYKFETMMRNKIKFVCIVGIFGGAMDTQFRQRHYFRCNILRLPPFLFLFSSFQKEILFVFFERKLLLILFQKRDSICIL